MEGSLRDLVEFAKTYVNKNRLMDLISKIGPLTENKQIGEYMKAFNEDWQIEFKEDFKEEIDAALFEYSMKDVKNVFKIGGKHAISLIKNHLEKEQEKAKKEMMNNLKDN